MLKKVLILLAIAMIAFVVIVAMQPAAFRISREATISAAPSAVFPQINDFHKWEAWSPWAKRDPAMKQSFEGPSEGVGSIYTWAGNNEVGEGRMTLTESRTNELVRIKLEFLKCRVANKTGKVRASKTGKVI